LIAEKRGYAPQHALLQHLTDGLRK